MAKKLIMIRHGALHDQYSGRFMGKTDVGLSSAGRSQAAAISGLIRSINEAHIIVSPLCRALETARIALESLNQSFDVVSDLHEIDFGAWEGKTFSEISAIDPPAVSGWSNFDQNFVFPDGEALQSFMQRMRRLARWITTDPAETVVAITHGGVIRFLICHFLGLEPRHYLLFGVDPASVSIIDLFGQTGVLTRLNDMCHLEKKDG
ncbi:MAG TPA: histidine phosphatase family protein [Smithellaceae bacterium]|nr:histidine phosphatase family protein [Smithellaceae bacterium]